MSKIVSEEKSYILEPYAVYCISGKFIVVQAKSKTEAITKVREEYGEESKACRKVE